MSVVWIIGREATMLANSHKYITEPFIVFDTEAEADAACDLVERISGERPRKTTGSLMSVAAAQRVEVKLNDGASS